MTSSAMPIFLLGAMRSGTTYFRNVLSANSQILSLGSELNRFWTAHGVPTGAVPSCAPLSEQDITTEAIENIRSYFERRYKTRNYPQHFCFRTYRKFRYKNETIFKSGEPFYLLNKSTHLLNKIPLVNSVFPDAKYIYLMRDIHSQCNSLFKHFNRTEKTGRFSLSYPQKDGHCWSYIEKQATDPESKNWNFTDLPAYWINLNKFALQALRQLPKSQVLIVNYTDVVKNLPDVLSTVADFLNLESINTLVSTNLINNQTSSPLTQWKNDLSKKQILDINQSIENNLTSFNFIEQNIDF
ncbi:MAG: sulfotransferase [Gammaproteobacteria bacterium]|nr:sulfotransferase [Gammaproteobacteria bacterium]